MNFLFSATAWEQYKEWLKLDKKLTIRIHELIKAIRRDPFTGIGKPEALRQNLKGYWSRRINKEHRIIYRIVEDSNRVKRAEILTCKFHY